MGLKMRINDMVRMHPNPEQHFSNKAADKPLEPTPMMYIDLALVMASIACWTTSESSNCRVDSKTLIWFSKIRS